jgi:hypothetical protein
MSWGLKPLVLVAIIVMVLGGAEAQADGHAGGGRMLAGIARGKPKLQPLSTSSKYYGQYSHHLPSDPSFFMLGVWDETIVDPSQITPVKAAGVNTFIGLTTDTNLGIVSRAGMHALLSPDWRSDAAAVRSPANNGWLLGDEIDMTSGPGAGYTMLSSILSQLPKDNRMTYANYGKGVTFWDTNSQAAQFANEYQDALSDDNYWFTDDDLCESSQGGVLLKTGAQLSDAQCHRASNYAATVERLRQLTNDRKPIWAFVEMGHPFTQGDWPSITPAEVTAATWQSIIGGAQGIIYFSHSFGGPNITDEAFGDPRYKAVDETVKRNDRRIDALAPVLNAPNVVSGWTHGTHTNVLVKWWRGDFYVLAGSTGAAGATSFSIPCVGNTNATVLNERRSVKVANGRWTDQFSGPNGVHIYRVAARPGCGL